MQLGRLPSPALCTPCGARTVLLLTNDAECRRRGLTEGLACRTVWEHVAAACPQHTDMLAACRSAEEEGVPPEEVGIGWL